MASSIKPPPSIGEVVCEAAAQIANNAAGLLVIRALNMLAEHAMDGNRGARDVITIGDVLAVSAKLAAALDAEIAAQIAKRGE